MSYNRNSDEVLGKNLTVNSDARRPVEPVVMREYSQGIMSDGPVILTDGQPMTPEQIVDKLNNYHHALHRITNELESWNLTEGDEDSAQAIRFGKAVLGA
jgi:hypothetical protein